MMQLFLSVAPLLAQLVFADGIPREPFQPTGDGMQLLTFEDAVLSSRFQPYNVEFRWSSSLDGHVYTLLEGDLVSYNVKTSEAYVVASHDVLPNSTTDCWISHDEASVLLTMSAGKGQPQTYAVLDVEKGRLDAVGGDGEVEYAELAPRGHSVVYVKNHDVWVRDEAGASFQVTHSGASKHVINGVADWLYEEEVLGSKSAMWFSPDGRVAAFMSFNETGVQQVKVPDKGDMWYPRPGSRNPRVSLSLVDVATKTTRRAGIDEVLDGLEDYIIGEVAWMTDAHDALMVRVMNRDQTMDWHVLVDGESGRARVVRQRDGRDGWLDNLKAMRYAGSLKGVDQATNETMTASVPSDGATRFYLDLSDESGWTHMYLHAVDGSTAPQQLTSGPWEVRHLIHIDRPRALAYFSASKRHSTEQHIYRLSLTTHQITPLVNDTQPGVWSAQFSPRSTVYSLTYRGPNVPYQQLINASDHVVDTWTDNAHVVAALHDYSLPNITYLQLTHPSGVTLNVRQQLPPGFNATRTYPVLLMPYSAPGSQTVLKNFHTPRWDAYVSSIHGFVIYTVDGRGTAGQGRAFRNALRGRIGTVDVQDQIWAARQLLAQHSFLDAAHVGIYGWSYGGFLAAKVLEARSGVFTFGMSVAPPTDWRFYDSICTERYLGTPAANPQGYAEAQVTDIKGFKDLPGSFCLAHGTADENVQFVSMALPLAQRLREGGVREQLRARFVAGADHSLVDDGGQDSVVSRFLTSCLEEEMRRSVDDEDES